MPQASDVEIAGAGYMLTPGDKSYRRHQAGAFARRSGRVEQTAFRGGGRQPFQLGGELESGWDGLGVRSVYGGAGVEPWPARSEFVDTIVALPAPDQRASAVVAGDRVYVAIGNRLYRTAGLTAANWQALALMATIQTTATPPVAIPILDLLRYKDNLMLLHGPGGANFDMRIHNVGTNATGVWVTGEQGMVGVGYKGQFLFGPGIAQRKEELRLSLDRYDGAIQFKKRNTDAPIVRMAAALGGVVAASRSALLFFNGEWDPGSATPAVNPSWSGDLQPIVSHGSWTAEDDFTFMLSYLGRVFTWLGGRVVVLDQRGETQGLTPIGPEGRACYGAAVAAGWLVVALVAHDGASELWGHDGVGWWRIRREAPGGIVQLWPAALAGVGNRDLLVFRSGSATYDLYRLIGRAGLPAYADAGEWRSSLLDAGDPSTAKGWLVVGALFASPEVRGATGSVDPVGIALDWSTDAGATWVQAAAATVTPGRSFVLSAALPAATSSRHLQLRARWSSVADWAPVLSGVWADWAIDDAPAPRRHWSLKVSARDRQIRRDGAAEARSGHRLAGDLWGAWAARAVVAFKDVDFDAEPVTRQVRIADISEEIPKGGDAGRWGESVVALTLIEA